MFLKRFNVILFQLKLSLMTATKTEISIVINEIDCGPEGMEKNYEYDLSNDFSILHLKIASFNKI